MINLYVVLFAVSIGVAGCSSLQERPGEPLTVYVSNGPIAIAISYSEHLGHMRVIGVESKDNPDAAMSASDQGGVIADCSEPGWRCIRFPGSTMVVPDGASGNDWVFDATSCERAPVRNRDVITCRNQRGRVISFEFSEPVGITSFSYDNYDDEVFELYAGRALLAPPR